MSGFKYVAERNNCKCLGDTCSCDPYKVEFPDGTREFFWEKKNAERYAESLNSKGYSP